MEILEKTFYIAPVIKSAVLGNQPMLCVSGEKYNLPQGIGIADYSDVKDSESNDW